MPLRRIESHNREAGSVLLRLGCSPDKKDILNQLASRFGSFPFSIDDRSIDLEVIPLESRELVESALQGELGIVCPDSIVRVEQIEDNWRRQENPEHDIVEEITIFAVSPLVIAMHPDSARRLGYPDKEIGWRDLISEAQENPDFKWVHPHVQSSAGILIALAEFHAAADVPEELSESRLRDSDVRNYIRNLEQTVQRYGPSETETITYALGEGEGEWRVDAFVAQERLILSACSRMNESRRPVIIYPKEGSAWIDHPLVLLSQGAASSILKRAYEKLRDYLLSADAQSLLVQAGFHPAGAHIRNYFSKAQVSATLSKKLHTSMAQVLSVPTASMLKSISSSWYTVKRPAAVYLVVDVSGSMGGDKLQEAKRGLLAFVDQFQNPDDAIGLIAFDSRVQEVVPIGPLSVNLQNLRTAIASLGAGGQTALLDAISVGYDRLHRPCPGNPIRAIVAMTDGQENYSHQISQDSLVAKITQGNNHGFPVAVFCLAYGSDADLPSLERLSQIMGATTERGTLVNIRQTYERMSTFV